MNIYYVSIKTEDGKRYWFELEATGTADLLRQVADKYPDVDFSVDHSLKLRGVVPHEDSSGMSQS